MKTDEARKNEKKKKESGHLVVSVSEPNCWCQSQKTLIWCRTIKAKAAALTLTKMDKWTGWLFINGTDISANISTKLEKYWLARIGNEKLRRSRCQIPGHLEWCDATIRCSKIEMQWPPITNNLLSIKLSVSCQLICLYLVAYLPYYHEKVIKAL